MAFESNTRRWAEDLFGGRDLGDLRRTDRLVDYAARQALDPEGSTARACRTSAAAREGAYRLLRNPHAEVAAIDDGAFDRVAELARGHATLLAIQDSTGISCEHPSAEVLGGHGGPNGFMVHTTLLVDADTHEPIGVVDQERWIRSPDRPSHPSRQTCRQRDYEEKESFKWEAASARMHARLADPSAVVTVADREADIYEFLQHQIAHGLRFVVRGCADRYLETPSGRLWDVLESAAVLGERVVEISQRGGQKAYGIRCSRSTAWSACWRSRRTWQFDCCDCAGNRSRPMRPHPARACSRVTVAVSARECVSRKSASEEAAVDEMGLGVDRSDGRLDEQQRYGTTWVGDPVVRLE